MHSIYRPDLLFFDFLDPELDKVFDFCLRNLLWSDPEQLRGFMGADPTESIYFADFGENGFERRLHTSALHEMFKDWPKWAHYKVTAYDFDGKDRTVRFYTAPVFEEHIRCGLRQYLKTFPERFLQIRQLAADIGLGKL
jgi:hypothetical protein